MRGRSGKGLNECDEDINSWIDRQHHAVIRVKTESLCVRMYYTAKYIMTNCSNRKLEARGKSRKRKHLVIVLGLLLCTIICMYVLCPEMKMLKYPYQGTHCTLCYVPVRTAVLYIHTSLVGPMSMKNETRLVTWSQMRMLVHVNKPRG